MIELTTESANRARLRLASRIVELGYHDSGFEAQVEPTAKGESISVTTPHCLQGDRCVWSSSPAPGDWFFSRVGETFQSEDALLGQALKASEVSSERTRRHLGCFHRRTRGTSAVLFRVLVGLRLAAPERELVLSSGSFLPGLLDYWSRWGGGPLEQREAHRVYALLNGRGDPLLLASTSGEIVARGATADLIELRWESVSDDELYARIRALALHS